MTTNNVKQLKEFIREVNRNIKGSNYKERQILKYIQRELQTQNCKKSDEIYCDQLRRIKSLFENFIRNNRIKRESQTTRGEEHLYRKVFVRLARIHKEQKYYDASAELREKPRLRLLSRKSST